MALSKKHFEALAAILKEEVELTKGIGNATASAYVLDHLDNVAWGIAKVARQDNPRFDTERFLRASGLKA